MHTGKATPLIVGIHVSFEVVEGTNVRFYTGAVLSLNNAGDDERQQDRNGPVGAMNWHPRGSDGMHDRSRLLSRVDHRHDVPFARGLPAELGTHRQRVTAHDAGIGWGVVAVGLDQHSLALLPVGAVERD